MALRKRHRGRIGSASRIPSVNLGVLVGSFPISRLVLSAITRTISSRALRIAAELWIRGPTVMKGYLNNPTATQKAMTPDGWFKTDDIVIVDDENFFTILDRLLLSHEDILDTAIIGVESREQATELPRYVYFFPSRSFNSGWLM
ncbi:hypothetical protein BS47DRAFT_1348853, partial [Hydnum rufescens UP504]